MSTRRANSKGKNAKMAEEVEDKENILEKNEKEAKKTRASSKGKNAKVIVEETKTEEVNGDKAVRKSVRKTKVVKDLEEEKTNAKGKGKGGKKNGKGAIEEEETTEKETMTVEITRKGSMKEEKITDEIEKEVTKKVRTNDGKEKIVEVVKNTKKEVIIEEEPNHAHIDIHKTKTVCIEKLLPREFYKQDVVTLSRELLGKIIVRKYDGKVIKARIVEAEAYAGIPDKACHAYNGKKTDRNKSMYLEGGHVYVYSIYGNNNCLNITASKEGDPSATLIRAVEVIEGVDVARGNRQVKNMSRSGKELSNGPGNLCKAMNIDKTFNAVDVTQPGSLYIIDDDYKTFEVSTTKRININYAEEYVDKPWRFCIKNNIFVSVKAPECDPEPLEKDTAKN